MRHCRQANGSVGVRSQANWHSLVLFRTYDSTMQMVYPRASFLLTSVATHRVHLVFGVFDQIN